MKFKLLESSLIIILFSFFSIFFFRNYIFKGLIPLPVNLLVSFYSPWKYEEWPDYPLGVPNKPIGTDVLKLFFPYKKFTIDELKSGHWPLWNPYVFSGNVHLASYQSAIFYPLNLIYFIFDIADAWSILVILQPVLAGWFTYLLLRSLSLSRKSCIFGAISFAFSGWMITHFEESLVIEHTILWLPLALFASNELWRYNINKAPPFLLLTIALSFSIFAGFLQMTIYLVITVLFWNMFLWKQCENKHQKRIMPILLIGSVFISMLLTSIQWAPALESFMLSPRNTVHVPFLFESFLMPFYHLITFFSPDFWGNPGSYNYFFPKVFYHEKVIYIGIIPILFSSYAMLQKRSPILTFWKIFAIITLTLGFALPTSWVWYALRVPIMSVAQPGRIFILATFSLCILASFGFEYYARQKRWDIIKKPLILLIGLCISLWVFIICMFVIYKLFYLSCLPEGGQRIAWGSLCNFIEVNKLKSLITSYATISLRNLIIPSFFLGIAWVISSWFSKKYITISIILFLTLASSLYFANKYLYFSDRKFIYPQAEVLTQLKRLAGINRVWSYGDAYVEKNILSYFRLYSPEGYDALYPQRYGELLYAIKNKGFITDQILRTDADLKPVSELESITQNIYRQRIMALLSVRYIIEAKTGDSKASKKTEERFPINLYRLTWENSIWRIWEFTSSLPRIFLTYNYRVEKDKQRIVNYIFDPHFNLRHIVILEEDPKFPIIEDNTQLEQPEEVNMTLYEPTKIAASINSPRRALLFLSDNYYPGWKAYIDGVETKIFRADYTFRSIVVPAGLHTVVFEYKPLTFTIGKGGSLIGLIIFLGVLYLVIRNKSKPSMSA